MGTKDRKTIARGIQSAHLLWKIVVAIGIILGAVEGLWQLFDRLWPTQVPQLVLDGEMGGTKYTSYVYIYSEGACERMRTDAGDHARWQIDDAVYNSIAGQFINKSEGEWEYRVYGGRKAYGNAESCSMSHLKREAGKQHPVDFNVFIHYKVIETLQDYNGSVVVGLTVAADMVDAHDSSLGEEPRYSNEGNPLRINRNHCDDSCVREKTIEAVRKLARDLGHHLEKMVDQRIPFTIHYDELTEDDLQTFRRTAETLDNYIEFGKPLSYPEGVRFPRISGHWKFSAKASMAKLEQLLFDRKAWGIVMSQEGRAFTLKRNYPSLDEVVVYAVLFIVLVVLVCAGFHTWAVVRHSRVLAGYAQRGEAWEGLGHLKTARRNLPVKGLEPRRWQEYGSEFSAALPQKLKQARAEIDRNWSYNQPYRAIALVDDWLAKPHGLKALDEVRPQLEAGRIGALTGPKKATLLAGKVRLKVFVAEQVSIGRGSSNDIDLSYGRISRKQCRLAVENESIVTEDLGSTNGYWLDDQELDPGSKVVIDPPQKVLTLGGQRHPHPSEPGPCRLVLALCGRCALFVRGDRGRLHSFDLADQWPEWANRWLCLFPEGYADLSLDQDGQFTAQAGAGTPLFRLYHRDGLFVGPPDGKETLLIDGAKVRKPVPWRTGAYVEVDGESFGLH